MADESDLGTEKFWAKVGKEIVGLEGRLAKSNSEIKNSVEDSAVQALKLEPGIQVSVPQDSVAQQPPSQPIKNAVPPMLADLPSGDIGPPQPQAPAMPPQVQPTTQPMPAQPQPASGGMVPMQTQITGALPPSKKLLAEEAAEVQRAKQLIDSKAQLDISTNEKMTEQARADSLQARQAADVEAAKQADAEAGAKDWTAKIDNAVNEYAKSAHINPNRYMENMGTGGRVLAAIGQAFGAFGSAITHSPNYAQEMIQRAIDNDIQAQVHEAQLKGQAVNMKMNQYQMFRNQGLDDRAARLALYQLRVNQTKAKIEEIRLGSNSQQILATAEQLQNGLDMDVTRRRMEQEKRTATTLLANPLMAGGGGTQLPANEAEKLGTANAAIKAAQSNYADWNKSAKGVFGYITSFFPLTDASRYINNRAMAKQVIGSYLEGGVLRKEDEAKYDKFLPIEGESQETGRRKLENLITLIATRADEQKKALGSAGFNVGGIKINKPPATFVPSQ